MFRHQLVSFRWWTKYRTFTKHFCRLQVMRLHQGPFHVIIAFHLCWQGCMCSDCLFLCWCQFVIRLPLIWNPIPSPMSLCCWLLGSLWHSVHAKTVLICPVKCFVNVLQGIIFFVCEVLSCYHSTLAYKFKQRWKILCILLSLCLPYDSSAFQHPNVKAFFLSMNF